METPRPTINQIMWMTPAQKANIPAWHVTNLAIKEAWSEHEYLPAICGVIFYPVMWLISYWIKLGFTKHAVRPEQKEG